MEARHIRFDKYDENQFKAVPDKRPNPLFSLKVFRGLWCQNLRLSPAEQEQTPSLRPNLLKGIL